ncbi:MAG: hypothetical protein ACERK6_12375 [Candidatus Aminicenantaceae bacterium]
MAAACPVEEGESDDGRRPRRGKNRDDLVGLINWTVRDTSWLDSGITTEAKVVDLTLQWPENWVRDEVRIVTAVAK